MDMAALSAGSKTNANAIAANAQKEANRRLIVRLVVGVALLSLIGVASSYSRGAVAYGLLALLFAAAATRVRLCGIVAIVFGVMALSQYSADAEARRFAALTPEQQAAEIATKKAQELANAEMKKAKEADDAAKQAARAERQKWDNAVWRAKEAVTAALKDPDSAQFGEVVAVSNDGTPVVCGSVNAKNSFGGFTGEQSFVYVAGMVAFEGDKEFNKLWNTVCADKQIKARG